GALPSFPTRRSSDLPQCHNIAYTLCAGDTVIDLFDRREVVESFLRDFATVVVDRTRPVEAAWRLARHIFVEKPGWFRVGGPWLRSEEHTSELQSPYD